MKTHRTAITILILMIFSIHPARSNEILHLESGEMKTTLVELFTSQGGSSCPPADEWLNKLTADPELWKSFVPIAYHVDYWDDLGWKDPYGSSANSNRQFSYNRSGRSSSVYTPGFFVNGYEWQGWHDGEKIPMSKGFPGKLSAIIKGQELSVKYSGTETNLELNMVLLGIGMMNHVKAGENRGRTLENSFVSLAHEIHPDSGGKWMVRLPSIQGADPPRQAIALWISHAGETTPLQATGGWLQK